MRYGLVAMMFVACVSTASFGKSGSAINQDRRNFNADCRAHGGRMTDFPGKLIVANDAVRVSGLALCSFRRTNRAILFFIASAMNRAAYTSGATAPWITIALLDERGRPIWSGRQLATVYQCGEYESHVWRLPAQFNVSQVDDVELHISGADRQAGRCDRGRLPRWTRQDVRNWIRDAGEIRRTWEEEFGEIAPALAG